MMAEVSFVLRVTVGILLLMASTSKLRDHRAFLVGIRSYGILPERLSQSVARAVPVAEASIALLLLTGVFLRVAAGVCLAMVIAFDAAQFINFRRGKRIPCHCFGSDPFEVISRATLARGAIVAAMSATVLLAGQNATPPSNTILPLAGLTLGLVLLVRLISVIPFAVSAYRIEPLIAPSSNARVSFRHAGLDVSLFGRNDQVAQASHDRDQGREALL